MRLLVQLAAALTLLLRAAGSFALAESGTAGKDGADLIEKLAPTEVLVATVPDPVHTSFEAVFDQMLASIRTAVDALGYVSDSSFLPWVSPHDDDEEDGAKPADDLVASKPGWLLFRRDEGKKRLLVLLVGETSTAGVHTEAMRTALYIAGRVGGSRGQKDARIDVLGPTFSGSARSLRTSLDDFRAWRGDRTTFRVLSGSATAPRTRAELTSEASTFAATVLPDDVRSCLFYRFLRRRLAVPMDDVALLVESNSAFGASFKQTPCKDADAQPLRPRLLASFPLHIHSLRSAFAKAPRPPAEEAKPALGRSQSAVELQIENARHPLGALPPMDDRMTAASVEQVLEDLLLGVCRQGIRFLGVVASDTRDLMVLGKAARKYCPRLGLFALSPDRLLHHSENRALRGMLVVSSYPLYGGAQTLSYPQRGRRRLLSFPSEIAQGVYNATLLLLGAPAEVVDYGFPAGGPPRANTGVWRPVAWISVLGNDGFLPITVAEETGPAAASYVEAIEDATGGPDPELRAEGVADRLSMPAGFVLLLLGPMVFGVLNLSAFLLQSNSHAPPSRRRSLWGWLDPYRAVRQELRRRRGGIVALMFTLLGLMNLSSLLLFLIPARLGAAPGMYLGAAGAAIVCAWAIILAIQCAVRPQLDDGPCKAWLLPRLLGSVPLAAALLLGARLLVGALAGHEPDVTFFFARVTSATGGVSVAVGAVFYALALFFAGISELNRLRLLSFESSFRARGHEFVREVMGKQDAGRLCAAVTTGWKGVAFCLVGAYLIDAVSSGSYHQPYEGAWVSLFARMAPEVLAAMMLMELYRFARVWSLVRRAFQTVIESQKAPDFREVLEPHLLATLTPPLDPTLEEVIARPLEPLERKPSTVAEPRAELDEDRTVVVDPRPGAEEYRRTVWLALLASYARAHMHNFLTFVTVAGLLLLLMSTSYPFALHHATSITTLVTLSLAVAVTGFVLVEMNRDEILSLVSGQPPGRVSLDRTFVRTVLIHVALPLLALISSKFSTLGTAVGDWIAPALELFKS